MLPVAPGYVPLPCEGMLHSVTLKVTGHLLKALGSRLEDVAIKFHGIFKFKYIPRYRVHGESLDLFPTVMKLDMRVLPDYSFVETTASRPLS